MMLTIKFLLHDRITDPSVVQAILHRANALLVTTARQAFEGVAYLCLGED